MNLQPRLPAIHQRVPRACTLPSGRCCQHKSCMLRGNGVACVQAGGAADLQSVHPAMDPVASRRGSRSQATTQQDALTICTAGREPSPPRYLGKQTIRYVLLCNYVGNVVYLLAEAQRQGTMDPQSYSWSEPAATLRPWARVLCTALLSLENKPPLCSARLAVCLCKDTPTQLATTGGWVQWCTGSLAALCRH